MLTRASNSASLSLTSSISRLLDVVLVLDLADDLFDQVLDRDQPGRAAVLVDDDRDVHAALLHLVQQLVDLLGLGHVRRLARQRLDAAPIWLPSRRNFSRSLAYTTPVMLSIVPS